VSLTQAIIALVVPQTKMQQVAVQQARDLTSRWHAILHSRPRGVKAHSSRDI